MATNFYGKSCTPNIGGVQDYYTKAEINQLFRQRREAEIVHLETGHVLVGNLASVQQQYELDPEYYIVDHDTGSVSNLSADRLRTARTLSLTGVVTGSVQSNLATGFTINTTVTLGSITGAMIADGTITDTDISPTAEIAVSKLADGTPRQLLQTDAAGTGVEWTSNVDVPGTLDVTGEARFDTNVTIAGNLTVSGTETVIDTVTLSVEDRYIKLGKVTVPTDITADGGGIILLGDTDKTIIWERATASWSLSEHLNIAAGRSYRINNVPVLSATALGASVQISTANIPPGTVTNDDLEGSIADTKLLTISTANKVAISALDIDGGSDIASALTDTDLFVVDDGGAGINRKAAATRITDYTFGKVSGDITITNTGTAAISAGVIVDADVSATAEIAVSKLADGTPRQLLQTDAAGTGVEWTSNVDIPGTLDVTGIATFDTKISIGTTLDPVGQQEVAWNADEATFDVGLLNGVTNQLGQEIQLLCRNDDTVTIPNGTPVQFSGTAGNSGRIFVKRMVADGSLPGYVFFGVTTQDIAVGADGYVTTFGKVRGVNTLIDEGGGVVWQDGDVLWCDPAVPGGLTKVEPQAPNLKLPVAAVVNAANNGVLMVRWDTGRRLKDLHDVEANGTTVDGDVLRYNATAGRWENSSAIDISGSLDVTGTATFDGSVVVGGFDITESARDIEESRLIRRNGTVSIGTPGQVPFGVGPIVPPGMSLVGIGADAYNVIDIYSGSVC
jgi:hypothetical protein